MQRTITNGRWIVTKSHSASKDIAVYLVVLEGHYVLWTPAKLGIEFKQVWFWTELIKGSNWEKVSEISQLEGCHLLSRQGQISHLFADSPGIGRGLARISYYTCPTHLILHLQFITYFELHKIPLMWRTSISPVNLQKPCGSVQKDAKFWKDGILRLLQRWWNKIADICI